MSSHYYFRKYFSTQFILEPKILREIDAELKNFLVENEIDLPIQYQLSSDGDIYTTSSLDKILKEPNSKGNRIACIVIKIGEERTGNGRAKSPVYIECRFRHGVGIGVRLCKVEVHDYRKDHQQVELADRLCDLFHRTQREASANVVCMPSWLRGGTPPTITFLLILFWLRRIPSLGGMTIGETKLVDVPLFIALLILVYSLCVIIWKAVDFPKYLDKKFPISGIFLWGAEEHDYKLRISLREKITWGIGVALLIGVISSLIATWITTK